VQCCTTGCVAARTGLQPMSNISADHHADGGLAPPSLQTARIASPLSAQLYSCPMPNRPMVSSEPSLDCVCTFLRNTRLSTLFKEREVVVLHELMTCSSALKVRLHELSTSPAASARLRDRAIATARHARRRLQRCALCRHTLANLCTSTRAGARAAPHPVRAGHHRPGRGA
jgi:hypothetical protein